MDDKADLFVQQTMETNLQTSLPKQHKPSQE